MSLVIDKENMQERFHHLFSVISGKRFLQKQGLGNEVPFFICPFQAKESVEMERLQKRLVNRLEQSGVQVLEINLYDPEAHLIPAIAREMAATKFDVLLLSGIGEVFPYIRSHNVLNNLQSTAKEKPTVLFFPGEYTHSLEVGASLDLFGKLHDDKYYRAFNIFHCEV